MEVFAPDNRSIVFGLYQRDGDGLVYRGGNSGADVDSITGIIVDPYRAGYRKY